MVYRSALGCFGTRLHHLTHDVVDFRLIDTEVVAFCRGGEDILSARGKGRWSGLRGIWALVGVIDLSLCTQSGLRGGHSPRDTTQYTKARLHWSRLSEHTTDTRSRKPSAGSLPKAGEEVACEAGSTSGEVSCLARTLTSGLLHKLGEPLHTSTCRTGGLLGYGLLGGLLRSLRQRLCARSTRNPSNTRSGSSSTKTHVGPEDTRLATQSTKGSLGDGSTETGCACEARTAEGTKARHEALLYTTRSGSGPKSDDTRSEWSTYTSSR